ncbi:ubiquinone biosynthesis O-methyltransferase, mitochondrial [Trichonephila inaurata madagascariensis]|uniref:Ubiquinone biosynthesis O-methyltransferase, mitochondrial n=1 Tax=Trichonephila inaurata madagascariensis TaxID=2747483 RepID=A0A8X7BRE1_9ARAC|nr:ubiquinone biosynthesis O-methyltransferase, mitochondrial [Trichonephila inaurata madagascariensis]
MDADVLSCRSQTLELLPTANKKPDISPNDALIELKTNSLLLVSKMATRLWSLASRLGLRNFWWPTLSNRNLTTTPKILAGSTVDTEEIGKFTERANEWWSGSYSALQSMNTLRVPLVRDGILYASGITAKKSSPLKGYKIVDVGCGGGLLSEPLARLGATVTGLDPGEENIAAATKHALQDDEIKNRLNYVCDTIENFSLISAGQFDAVVCSEVIEHVADVQTFVNACVELTKDGGSLFFTTINRTNLSYMLSILAGEYILNILPRGTHDWNKFVQPKELSDMLTTLNCRIVSINGMFYNPLSKNWSWCGDSSNNYALHAIK